MEKLAEKTKARIQSIGPFIVFENGNRVGSAFTNYVVRKSRVVNIIVQIKDPKDRKNILETFLVRLPLPVILLLAEAITQDGKVKEAKHKWEVRNNYATL